MYDVYTPLSETETALTYEESLKKAEEVLAIFGEEYSKGVHAAFTERWIDVHPNKGKRCKSGKCLFTDSKSES